MLCRIAEVDEVSVAKKRRLWASHWLYKLDPQSETQVAVTRGKQTGAKVAVQIGTTLN